MKSENFFLSLMAKIYTFHVSAIEKKLHDQYPEKNRALN